MASTAFVIGFFTAFGWWTANKVIVLIDKPTIKQEQIIKEEKQDDNRN